MTEGRIMVVDDDRDMCEVLSMVLTSRGYEVDVETDPDAALAEIARVGHDVVISDIQMPRVNGIEMCRRIADCRPGTAVVIITAFGSMDTAISAIRAGAYDFLPKPFEHEHLLLIVERAMRYRATARELTRLRKVINERRPHGSLQGESPAMRQLFEMLDRLTESEASILIHGESGTGKELVARAIHERSRRAGGPFVAVNCAAVPSNLLESELFGHVKGAFTDAHNDRKGLFAQADGGSLFLDEIGEMPVDLQPKLLRALQERSMRPVGGDREVRFDVRIIAATNRDLEAEVDAGRFREDLYFRINVIGVQVPPLRSRGRDVLLLAQQFLRESAGRTRSPVESFSTDAAERLMSYDWPGNVRELQNCVEHAVALARHSEIVPADFPEKVRAYRMTNVLPATDDPAELVSMEEVERRYIERVLTVVRGNKSHAARILGYDRKTLYRRMEKFDIGHDFGTNRS